MCVLLTDFTSFDLILSSPQLCEMGIIFAFYRRFRDIWLAQGQTFSLVNYFCPLTIYYILKLLKTELPYDPAVPLLGTYPEKTIIQKDTCTPVFTVALFRIARDWKKPNCPSVDKDNVVCIYNGILLSHKKEWNWVICRDVDGPRVCHIEWSKSERAKQILTINA